MDKLVKNAFHYNVNFILNYGFLKTWKTDWSSMIIAQEQAFGVNSLHTG